VRGKPPNSFSKLPLFAEVTAKLSKLANLLVSHTFVQNLFEKNVFLYFSFEKCQNSNANELVITLVTLF
jgi:hypothetical protein